MALERLSLVVMCAAACSDTSGGGGPIKVEDLRAAYTAYLCNSAARCGLVDSSATCRTLRFSASGNYSGLFTDSEIEAAKAGLMQYDGDAASTCLGSFFSTCDRNYLATDRARVDACDHMFTATAGSGAACGTAEECISGYCSLTAQCMGTCSGGTPPPARPKVGESCMQASNCIDSWCDTTMTTWTCEAFLATGDPCNSDNQCQPGLSCRNGTCKALAATGGTCLQSSDCSSIGDYCNGATCTKLGLTGDACTSSSQCAQPFYRCDTATELCALGPRVGDSCSTNGTCIDQSYCDTQTFKCVALLADGATCTSSDQCQGGSCSFTTGTGTCTTPQVCY